MGGGSGKVGLPRSRVAAEGHQLVLADISGLKPSTKWGGRHCRVYSRPSGLMPLPDRACRRKAALSVAHPLLVEYLPQRKAVRQG